MSTTGARVCVLCERVTRRSLYCDMHYDRFRLYGDPLKDKERTPESLSRRIPSRLRLPTDPADRKAR